MRKTREIIRLGATTELSNRQIAQSCGVSPTSVGMILKLARNAGLNWPLPELSDSELAQRLEMPANKAVPERPLPDFACMAGELRRKGVTRHLLWQEYRRLHPDDGYSYSQFCEQFRRWHKTAEPTMRLEHKAGDKMFVDWAGGTLKWQDGTSGAAQKAYLFVAVLGASNYTYAEVFKDMSLASWLQGHNNAFAYFRGVPALVVPDNTKTAVTRPCRYDPDLNHSYQQLAEHYGTAVLPARVRKPRDKGKVENGVLNASRWIIASLRDEQFLGFGPLYKAVQEKLAAINERPFSKMAGSRRSVFEQQEAPELKPLPPAPFDLGDWAKATVFIDYHIQVDWHYYSVHPRYIGEKVDVRLTATTVEVFHDNLRIAVHTRSYECGKATTLPEHRTEAHRHVIEQSADSLLRKAEKIGPRCVEALREIQSSYPRPEMSFRGCEGVLRLAGKYSPARLEAACGMAIENGVCQYRTILNMLENRREDRQQKVQQTSIRHRNIRGGPYYAGADAGRAS